MWNALLSEFQRKEITNQLLKVGWLKLDKSIFWKSHFLVFDGIIRKLKASSAKLDGLVFFCNLLLTLPTSSEMVITVLETSDNAREQWKCIPEWNSKIQVKLWPAQTTNLEFTSFPYPFKCHGCGTNDHKTAECRKNVYQNNIVNVKKSMSQK